jgi:pyruvate/2-oxoglutarate/acetoin dehydrogenase E1 component
MDQLVNQAAKMCYMFGGNVSVPMVIRVPAGTGRSAAAQHSQSLEAWLMHIPGLKVVCPSTPYDAKGLLKSAIRDDNPVVFIENKITYNLSGEVPDEDYTIPIGKADIKREGQDVTLLATGNMVHYSLKAADELQQEGISCEVIDPRTLRPIDYETIINSVVKTSRLAIVQEACRTAGPGCEFAATVQERAFDYLDAPIIQIAGMDVPIPFNPKLEKTVVPSVEQIVREVKALF